MADNEDVLPRLWLEPTEGEEDFNQFENLLDAPAITDPDPVHLHFSTWETPPKANPYYASFGDQGVTASVNAYGDLMQFGRYLGQDVGTSGMFSADHIEIPEPFWVQSRAEELQSMYDDQGLRKTRNDKGTRFGLVFDSANIPRVENRPALKYVCDRWPRFEYDLSEIKVTIQWMVHDDIVLQQYAVTNGAHQKNISFSFEEGMWIRELEYLDPSNRFNDPIEPDVAHKKRKGPQNISWILEHELVPKTKKQGSGEPPEGAPSEVTENTKVENISDGTNSSIKTEKVAPFAVAVIAAVFCDGKALQWNDKPWTKTLQGQETLQVVTAYNMILLPESKVDVPKSMVHWTHFWISAESANVNKFLQSEEEAYSSFSLSGISSKESKMPVPKTTLGIPEESLPPPFEFLLHRHLEHILSVCAIPLREGLMVTGKATEPKKKTSLGGSTDTVPVALTCGDISAHRVCTSASFFAFRFLIDVAIRLEGVKLDSYAKILRERIIVVCKGHLAWLLDRVDRPNGYFSANYWVSGATMLSESPSWMPKNALTDTAFQLIKLAEFDRLCPDAMKEISHERIQNIYKAWIKDLRKQDKRGDLAWSKRQSDDANVFRLDDHIWIWKALKSVEDLGLSEQAYSDEDSSSVLPIKSSGVLRETLGHFTTLNDVSGKRMLAVTRSSRETRFLLHARDTVIFYGIDWGLPLEDTSYSDVWRDTLEAQVHHNENQETGWTKPLRYALAMAMGSRENSLNKKSPAELVKSSSKVLMESTSANGFFPGLLNENTKEPHLFDEENERDSYFHASFEIPLIILRRAAAINEKYKEAPEQLEKTQQREFRQNIGDLTDMVTTQPKYQERGSAATPDFTAALLERLEKLLDANNSRASRAEIEIRKLLDAKSSKASRKPAEMKKNFPFNALINQSNIVDVLGEWLYNYPSFLQSDEGVKLEDAEKQIEILSNASRDVTKAKLITIAAIDFTKAREARQALKEASKEKEKAQKALDELKTSDNARYDLRDRLVRALSKAKDAYDTAFAHVQTLDQSRPDSNFSTENTAKVTVVDTPKSSQSNPEGGHQNRKERADREITTFDNSYALWRNLGEPRKSKNAKKRLIWISKATAEAALVCYLTSPEEEKQAMLDFFNRHTNFDKWFYDDTDMARNTWTSELHLSFYQLNKSCFQSRQLSSVDTLETPFFRASMGFRFYGDFFDKYWTCHIIEHVPTAKPDFPEWLRIDSVVSEERSKSQRNIVEERAKSQRKVLELHFVNRILTEIVKSTLAIFEEVKSGLGIRGNLDPNFFFLSRPTSDDYFESSRRWEKGQQLLRSVEADLSTVLEKVAKWEMREKDRGQERPRWTRKDEAKYGRIISKLSILINGNIGELKNCCSSIKSLKETVDASLDRKREELSFRGSENIRIFTYVTVAFLPLGFAASIFSVEHAAVGHLVICAVIALVVTIVALFNAATVYSIYEHAANRAEKYSTSLMAGSYLKTLRQQESAEASSSLKASPEKKHEPPVIAGQSHSWFWMGYVLVELPARQVLQAYYALKYLKGERGKDIGEKNTKEPKPQEQDAKQLEMSKPVWPVFLCVSKGLLFLPLFILSWLVQLVVYNISDLLRKVWDWLVVVFSPSLPGTPAEAVEKYMLKMAYPLEDYRPLLPDSEKTQRVDLIEGVERPEDGENVKIKWSDQLFSVFGIKGEDERKDAGPPV